MLWKINYLSCPKKHKVDNSQTKLMLRDVSEKATVNQSGFGYKNKVLANGTDIFL